MFDIGFSEIVLIAIVALLIVDPKDLPSLMYKAGRFFRQFKLIMSRVSNTVGDVMHELEVESYRQQYKDKQSVINGDQTSDGPVDMLSLNPAETAPKAITHQPATETDPPSDHTGGAS